MSRFTVSTLLAGLGVAISLAALPSPYRLALAAALTFLYLFTLGFGVAFIQLNFFLPALCRGSANRREIALTFDDGPDPESTPALLDLLRTNGVHATFFCVGERARRYPDLVRRIANEGHTLGNHSEHHAWWTNFLFGRALDSELTAAQRSIESSAGVRPRYYRPPLGLTNPHYRSALDKAGLRLVGWHLRSFDLRRTPVETIAKRVCAQARPGSIVAMHDVGPGRARVLQLVQEVIAYSRAHGYSLVCVDRFDEGAANCLKSQR